MTRDKVDELLKAYRMDVGRCGHLRAEIGQLEKDIKRAAAAIGEDLTSIKSPQITDMPHGTGVGNPTERMGMMLASGWVSSDVKELERELADKRQEYEQRYFTVVFVSAWLEGLSERERWIIEHQVIDGEFWREVIAKFGREFEEVSKDTLKRLRQRALEKIYLMAE